jgi:ribose transport system permease protein
MSAPARSDLRLFVERNRAVLLALVVLVAMFAIYLHEHPRPVSVSLLTAASNKAVVLALVAMAQTVPVLTRGLDLSVGSVMIMAACASSELVNGAPAHVALGVALVLLAGAVAGAINGTIVVVGRIQPIIATLATGAVYFGIALWLRPTPGGDVSEGLSNALTYATFGVPTTFLLLVAVLVLVWLPFRHSVLGRGCYAAGSAEGAAYMSGVPIGRCKLAAYVLGGILAALAGLLLSLEALTGEASAPQAGAYTLNSIAAVVVGGTSLFGGTGGMVGSAIGAFVLRTIGDLLFVFDAPPLWQPLFEGVILLAAVSLGAARVLRIRNRLELFT